jgi:hypothetical protein
MDVQIKKQLGSGWIGTVYLASVKDRSKPGAVRKDVIYKIEKAKITYEMTHTYPRQIVFDAFARKHPDRFMTLVQHGVLESCSHIQKLEPDAPLHVKKAFDAQQKKFANVKTCYYLMYEPVLEGTLNSIMHKLTRREYIDMVIQLVESINLLRKAGYHHFDIHDRNVMYRRSKTGKHRYDWFIIDYGCIYHKSWPKNKDDKRDLVKYSLDLDTALWNCIMYNPARFYLIQKKIKWPKFEIFFNRLITPAPPAKNETPKEKKAREATNSLIPLIKKEADKAKIIPKKDRITILFFIRNYKKYVDAFGIVPWEKARIGYERNVPQLLELVIKHEEDTTYDTLLRKIKEFA